jgi:hypothetical protein
MSSTKFCNPNAVNHWPCSARDAYRAKRMAGMSIEERVAYLAKLDARAPYGSYPKRRRRVRVQTSYFKQWYLANREHIALKRSGHLPVIPYAPRMGGV